MNRIANVLLFIVILAGGVNAFSDAYALHRVTLPMQTGFKKTVESGYFYDPQHNQGDGSIWVVNSLVTLDCTLPAPVSSYASVEATFFVDGRADDGFIAYLNDQEVARWSCGCVYNPVFGGNGDTKKCLDPSQASWPRCQKKIRLPLSQQRNILKLSSYNSNSWTFTEVWNAKATVTAKSK